MEMGLIGLVVQFKGHRLGLCKEEGVNAQYGSFLKDDTWLLSIKLALGCSLKIPILSI